MPQKYTQEDIIDGTEKVLSNGMLAGKVMTSEGKQVFRIIGLAGKEGSEERATNMAKLKRSSAKKRSGRRGRKLTPSGAMRAFNRHYKNSKKYNTTKGRASAKGRDLCWDNQELVDDARYSRSPHRYDFKGVDDGSRCDSGPRSYKNKGYKPSGYVEKGRPIMSKADKDEWVRKMKEAKEAKKQAKSKRGGGRRPVSLKTAVRLLRQYYEEKYA